MICHKDFQRMMLDAEIYVDHIEDMRISSMTHGKGKRKRK